MLPRVLEDGEASLKKKNHSLFVSLLRFHTVAHCTGGTGLSHSQTGTIGNARPFRSAAMGAAKFVSHDKYAPRAVSEMESFTTVKSERSFGKPSSSEGNACGSTA